ncbi:hypothetical protein JW977_04970 [Candidatus Falkowbacteria bacterium]|nr:hypothetical protein [Candidatus Falkowbacteria bacterium]
MKKNTEQLAKIDATAKGRQGDQEFALHSEEIDPKTIDVEKLMNRTTTLPPLSKKYNNIFQNILDKIPQENEFIHYCTVIGTEEKLYLKEAFEEYQDVLDKPEKIPSEEIKKKDRRECYKEKAVKRWGYLRDLLSDNSPGNAAPDKDYINERIEPYFGRKSTFRAFLELIKQKPDGVFAVPTGAINAEIIFKAMMEGFKFETEKQGWEGVEIPYFTYPHSIMLTRDQSPGKGSYKELIASTEPAILHIYNRRGDPQKVKVAIFDECSETGGSRDRVKNLVKETYAKLQKKGQVPQTCKLETSYIPRIYPGISEAYRFLKVDKDSLDRRPVSIKDGLSEFRREQLAFKLASIYGFFMGRKYGNIIVNLDKIPKNQNGEYKYGYHIGSEFYYLIQECLKRKL